MVFELEPLLKLWIGGVALSASIIPFLLVGLFCFTAWSVYQHRPMQSPSQTVNVNPNANPNKVLIIDDYSDFVNECWEKEGKRKKKPENLQKLRMKEKQKAKRRIRNRIAKKSRRANRR